MQMMSDNNVAEEMMTKSLARKLRNDYVLVHSGSLSSRLDIGFSTREPYLLIPVVHTWPWDDVLTLSYKHNSNPDHFSHCSVLWMSSLQSSWTWGLLLAFDVQGLILWIIMMASYLTTLWSRHHWPEFTCPLVNVFRGVNFPLSCADSLALCPYGWSAVHVVHVVRLSCYKGGRDSSGRGSGWLRPRVTWAAIWWLLGTSQTIIAMIVCLVYLEMTNFLQAFLCCQNTVPQLLLLILGLMLPSPCRVT